MLILGILFAILTFNLGYNVLGTLTITWLVIAFIIKLCEVIKEN